MSQTNASLNQQPLMKPEMVFMKHCAPNHVLVHKDGTLSSDKGLGAV